MHEIDEAPEVVTLLATHTLERRGFVGPWLLPGECTVLECANRARRHRHKAPWSAVINRLAA